MPQPILNPKAICQVAVVVRDVDHASQAVARVFGLPQPRVVVTEGPDQTQVRYRGQPTAGRARLAFFDLGSLQLELIQPIDGPSTWQEVLDARGPCLHHIAFRVEGMNQALAGLEAAGLPTVQRGEFTGGRYAYVDGSATVGAVLELLEADR